MRITHLILAAAFTAAASFAAYAQPVNTGAFRTIELRAGGTPPELIGPYFEHVVTASFGTGDIDSTRTLDTGRLLLCSDGVYGRLSAAAIGRALRIFTDPQTAARRLVRAAQRCGSTDNATALVIDPPGYTAQGGSTPLDTV